MSQVATVGGTLEAPARSEAALGVGVRQALCLVWLVIARSAAGDLVTVQGRLC